MSLLDSFMTANKDFFAKGERAIEAKVGSKVSAAVATCCGNCQENIIRPPHVCRMLDTPGSMLPSMKAVIMNPYTKLKDCPYPVKE